MHDEQLTSGSGPVKRLRKLVTQRKARSRERAFVVEGPTLVAEALEPRVGSQADGRVDGRQADGEVDSEVEAVFVEADRVEPRSDLVTLADRRGVAVHRVEPGVLMAILDPVTPQPVAAIVPRRRWELVDIVGSAAGSAMVLCLVEARDPGNVGTLIRSVEAAGGAGVVLAGHCVDPTNPKTVRASAGSVLRVPIVELVDVDEAMTQLRAAGLTTVATVAEGKAIPYDEVRLVDTAVLLGNEAHGLPEGVVARADVTATIPLAGATESLNVAVAGSLFCFEALRQARRERTSRSAAHSGSNSLDTATERRQVDVDDR